VSFGSLKWVGCIEVVELMNIYFEEDFHIRYVFIGYCKLQYNWHCVLYTVICFLSGLEEERSSSSKRWRLPLISEWPWDVCANLECAS
jgi:hypothetical protein